MRVAHIIMAHKNPAQLSRLTKSLRHPNFDIYIHIDAKVPIHQFEEILTNHAEVFFIKERSTCNWGGFSLFKGIIECLKQVLNTGIEYDYINLISGQDYPVKTADEIFNFLKAKKGTIFISFEDSSNSEWWRTATHRYERYHLTDFNFTGKYALQWLLNKITPIRKFPDSMKLYGGNKSCWWTLTNESAVYIVNKLKNRPDLYNFLKFCWGTDEFIIPTLIMNSELKNKVINDNLRYIDWSEGNAHPKILLSSDYNMIKDSNMLFARKFDSVIDDNILNMIDADNFGTNHQ